MIKIEDVINKASEYGVVNSQRIIDAFHFAEEAHAGQTRKSGVPYITHPVAVAYLLAEYKADENSIITALLHDVVEDTPFDEHEVEKRFGKTVRKMVVALTKLPHSNIDEQGIGDFNSKIESIRKIFDVMQEDVRVLVIKLCDRLHNMSTLQHFRVEKQQRIAQETLDIYVKIADRLCLYDLKERLEELCFRFLYPEEYQIITDRFKTEKKKFLRQKEKILKKLQTKKQIKSSSEIIIRRKIPFSLLLESPEKDSKIPIHVYINTASSNECFVILKEVHELWKNLRGEFKDYITLPKSNGFKALQTTVIRSDSSILKFVISTPEMYEYSRNGVMLECFNSSKEGKKIHLPWIENLKKIHQKTKEKSTDYLTALQNDILQGAIIVYIEDEKTLFLPPKCTALDAAFYALGEKANRVTEVRIDQVPVLFSYHLKDGERLSFVLSKVESINYKWVNYVQTSFAKSFIYERLKSYRPHKKELIAKEILQEGLNERRLGYLDEISDDRKESVAHNFNVKDWKSLLHFVTEGKYEPGIVLAYLFEKHENAQDIYKTSVVIKRRNGDESINRIFSAFKENAVPFTHLSTTRYDHFYIDHFQVEWSLKTKNTIYSYFKEYLHFNVRELLPIQRTFIPYLYLIGIPVLWSLNTFISRYVMHEGLSVTNTTELRFISASVVLYILAAIKGKYAHQKHSAFQYPFLFFFVALALTAYTYLINLSLYYTESIYYIIPVSVSFVLVAVLYTLKSFYYGKKSLTVILQSTVAVVLSVLAIFVIFLEPGISMSQKYGITISCVVLILHMIYNYFGNKYHRKYKVQSRSILLLSYTFGFASLVFLPFVDLQNLRDSSLIVLGIAIVNGAFTGGIAHFFFFEATKYLQHYKLTLSMTMMVLMTFVVGAIFENTASIFTFGASILMIGALCLAARFEYKKQGIFEDIQHLA